MPICRQEAALPLLLLLLTMWRGLLTLTRSALHRHRLP
jgi:hypothetical protein